MKRSHKKYTHWNKYGDDSHSNTESEDDGWFQGEELTERHVKWKKKKDHRKRMATKAAKAAVDASLNPRTGRKWNAKWKRRREGGNCREVFDAKLVKEAPVNV